MWDTMKSPNFQTIRIEEIKEYQVNKIMKNPSTNQERLMHVAKKGI